MPAPPTSNPMNAPTPFFMPEPQGPPPPIPQQHQHQHQQQQQVQQAPDSPVFDPLTAQPFNPATTMMPQVTLIPDDLQSLRSMGSNTPEPDIEMTDGPLMPDYSSPFPLGGMHTPPQHDALASPALGHHQHAEYYHHEAPHAF